MNARGWYEPAMIVVVRPTRDGKWETLATTQAENRKWQQQWDAWMKAEGELLARDNPEWWPK